MTLGYHDRDVPIGNQAYQVASLVYDRQTSAVVRRHHLGGLSELGIAAARSGRERHHLANLHGCFLSVRRTSIRQQRL